MTNPMQSKLPFGKRCLLSAAALIAMSAPIALGLTGSAGLALAATAGTVENKHYRNDKWKFELDVPKQWIEMPPVPSNGPEVVRFHSQDRSVPLALIIWRKSNYPKHTPKSLSISLQRDLAKEGLFSNFVSGETSIGSRRVQTLDFERTLPDGSLLSCRSYFIVDGGVQYVLGFGTSSRDTMFDTFARVANSFAFEEP